jgi:hypothetical protein
MSSAKLIAEVVVGTLTDLACDCGPSLGTAGEEVRDTAGDLLEFVRNSIEAVRS